MRITEKSLKIAFKNIKFFAVSKSIYIREESFLKILSKNLSKNVENFPTYVSTYVKGKFLIGGVMKEMNNFFVCHPELVPELVSGSRFSQHKNYEALK